jgi:hypothetical protein
MIDRMVRAILLDSSLYPEVFGLAAGAGAGVR